MRTDLGETPIDLTGQVALVTGGGRGLGRAFTLALAAAGAQVAVTARTAAQVAETVQQIEGAGGCALAIPGDVSVPNAVTHVVTTTAQQLGPVDLLVNNAGWHVPGSLGYAWEVDPESWWHTFEINLRGAFLCARAVLSGMIQRHRGRIVNISSGTAVNANPFMDALCASKAALTHWTRCCHGARAGPFTGLNRRGGQPRRAPGEPCPHGLDRVKSARPRRTEVPRRSVGACRLGLAPRQRGQPKTRMRKNCTAGTVRGVPGNWHSYRRDFHGKTKVDMRPTRGDDHVVQYRRGHCAPYPQYPRSAACRRRAAGGEGASPRCRVPSGPLLPRGAESSRLPPGAAPPRIRGGPDRGH